MKISWTFGARQDRRDIWDYLHDRDPAAAVRIDALFGMAAARLVDFPMLGHPGEIAGTRELTTHPNYRLVYEIAEDRVFILAVVHGRRRWPPLR